MRIEKTYIVRDMQEKYQKSTLLVVTSYHGMKAQQNGALRSGIAEANGTFHVVPNRLLKIALPETAEEKFKDSLQGANALAATDGDLVELAKVIKKFADDNKNFEIRCGLLELSRYLTADEVKALAALPSKKALYSMLVSALQGPIRKLACFGNVLITNTVRVLDQVAQKKGEGAAAPAAE